MALDLLSEAAHHVQELKCDSLYLTQVYWLGILISLDVRNYLQAARYLLLAFASSPGETSRRVIKKMTGLFSSGRNKAQTAH
jgi:hypothetical protein